MRTASLLVSALLALVACQPPGEADASSGSEGGAKQREIPKVRVTRVETRPMARVLETTSKLESEREIEIIPRTSGIVLSLEAEEGDVVRANDVLARLDDLDLKLAVSDAEVAIVESEQAIVLAELAVEEADARLASSELAGAQATRDWERDVALFEGRAGENGGDSVSALSRKALETSRLAKDNADADTIQAEIAQRKAKLDIITAKNSLARAQVTLERAKVALERTRLVSPIDGIIAERTLRVGALANTTEKAFVVTDPTRLRAVFYRPQEEYALFQSAAGRKHNADARLTFRATSEAWPGATFEGWIEHVSPTLDAESSQFRVTAQFDSPGDEASGARLLPGMLVRLAIETDRHENALAVPKRSLRREGDRRFVLIVEEGRLRRVDVKEELDFADHDHIEVRPVEEGALKTGDALVTVGSRDLVDGDRVTIDAPTVSDVAGE